MDFKVNSIEEAIKDFKEGKFVIVVDDEDRENEGDLIIAAEKVTDEKVNFMLKNARGVLCAPITLSRCEELDLPKQVIENTSVLGTPFTVTVDKLEGCTTGVSAHDRAETLKALADPNSKPSTFGRPGHVNPLYAQDNGVLSRSGHTEAAVDLCKLAGLYPAGALMEIMNEDGTMARMPELQVLAKEWDMKIITIKDLIAYRLQKETSIEVGEKCICQLAMATLCSFLSVSRVMAWSIWHWLRANGTRMNQYSLEFTLLALLATFSVVSVAIVANNYTRLCR